MTDPLFVQADGVREISTVHSRVASGLSGLPGADGTGVQTSHGAVAAAVGGALRNVLDDRRRALGVTSTSAATIADLLDKAAAAYAAGDEEAGSRLSAAATALEGGRGSTPCGAPGAALPGVPAAAGTDMAGQLGQIMGQVGQQVGQLAQAATAPLQGLAQGLQQVPQQILQGVAQAAQSTQTGQDGLRERGGDTDDDRDGERADDRAGDAAREDDSRTREPAEPTPAQAGQAAEPNHVPAAAPPPVAPAPTRPQVG